MQLFCGVATIEFTSLRFGKCSCNITKQFQGSNYWKFDQTSDVFVRNDIYPKVRHTLSWIVEFFVGHPKMVGWSAGWHGRSPPMGKRQNLLLQRRQLLEVQRPVSPPLPCPAHILRRFMVDTGSPPFPRDAQDWLFSCFGTNEVQVGNNFQLFGLFWREMFPKESDNIKQQLGVQVGDFEEPLVIERTIPSNPFLVMIPFGQRCLGLTLFFFRMKRLKKILGLVMRCWTSFHLMSEGKF